MLTLAILPGGKLPLSMATPVDLAQDKVQQVSLNFYKCSTVWFFGLSGTLRGDIACNLPAIPYFCCRVARRTAAQPSLTT